MIVVRVGGGAIYDQLTLRFPVFDQLVHSGLANEMPFVELNNVLYIYQLGIIYAIFW